MDSGPYSQSLWKWVTCKEGLKYKLVTHSNQYGSVPQSCHIEFYMCVGVVMANGLIGKFYTFVRNYRTGSVGTAVIQTGCFDIRAKWWMLFSIYMPMLPQAWNLNLELVVKCSVCVFSCCDPIKFCVCVIYILDNCQLEIHLLNLWMKEIFKFSSSPSIIVAHRIVYSHLRHDQLLWCVQKLYFQIGYIQKHGCDRGIVSEQLLCVIFLESTYT